VHNYRLLWVFRWPRPITTRSPSPDGETETENRTRSDLLCCLGVLASWRELKGSVPSFSSAILPGRCDGWSVRR
jgi:hypothetical protein